MTPSDSLPHSIGLRASPLYQPSPPCLGQGHARASPVDALSFPTCHPWYPGGATGGCACPTSRGDGFPAQISGRPPLFGLYEATYRFTCVTACRFASPPCRDFVGPLRYGVLPLHTRPHATGLTSSYPGRLLSADEINTPFAGRSFQKHHLLRERLTTCSQAVEVNAG
jgi:hypothetical protein